MSFRTHDRHGSVGAVTPALVALLLVVGMASGGAASWFVLTRDDPAATDRVQCERVHDVDLAVAAEMYATVVAVLDDLIADCTRVEPVMRPGIEVAGSASLGGGLPDIWIPEARFLTSRAYLGDAARVRVVARSLARTPVLLVGGAEATRYASWRQAESSGTVSVPDPQTSAVGALAVLAPQAEARQSGADPVEARSALVPFAQTYGARRSRGADESVRPGMFPRRSTRLVVTTEQALVEVAGRTDLRDLTPGTGAPVLDFPLAVDADAEPEAREVARELAAALAAPEGREEVRGAGLRPTAAAAPPGGSAVAATLQPPSAASIVATVQSWRSWAIPSSILTVVDVSGSMDADAGGRTRMELLAEAAGIGLSFLPDHARVGLWVFSIDKGGPGRDWRELEPLRRLDDLRFGRTQRYALRERAAELPALTSGGTGLYDTALAAYEEGVRKYRPHYSNAVVLMTDGRNEDPGSIGLDALLARLRELRDPQRPVRLVGIAISQDADLAALRRISHTTGGEAYLAERPQDVLDVFAQAVLSR
ncbi:Mg-chelatase subunit ChlD [Nocardioides cavernae]|uniref:Mg-chelatase subunit ChlD n=1 Tax=Nocardioides cavernae TaxID=1921566 RepID=A0A7Y9KTY5_9ACTN|nr:VWA domain-containing protein [Nocardioides cavernae]NYE37363.1 Mg-chelatase subunit ChlD [Nocardioides cavernae]